MCKPYSNQLIKYNADVAQLNYAVAHKTTVVNFCVNSTVQVLHHFSASNCQVSNICSSEAEGALSTNRTVCNLVSSLETSQQKYCI